MENIDREVAEKVMGFPFYKPKASSWNIETRDSVNWHPSTDIAQAFMVVEKMREKGWHFWLDDEPSHFPNSESGLQGYWCCEFSRNQAKGEIYEAVAKTKEEAICLAALEVVKQSSLPGQTVYRKHNDGTHS